MKLVINTNILYKKPLTFLFKSIFDANFLNFNDIILIVSGSSKDSFPEIKKLKNYIDINTEEEVAVVHTQLNVYDYAGFNMLNLFKDHELIKSCSYLYIHDTCTVSQDFYDKFLFWGNKAKETKNKIFFHRGCNSNICLFNYEIIENYKDNFNFKKISKSEAVLLEIRDSIEVDNLLRKNIKQFGEHIIFNKRRVFIEDKDIYDSGYERRNYFYEEFGINKWIFMMQYGDINNNVKKIIL